MKKFLVTNEAKQDVIDIGRYISENSPSTTDILLREINSKFSLFCEQPEIGRTRNEILPNLRSFPVRNYVIFYRDNENEIEITRVLHGSRDFAAIFENDRKKFPAKNSSKFSTPEGSKEP